MNCDLLVHECTLPENLLNEAHVRGHSTFSMALNFATKVNAKILALNHFGRRLLVGQEFLQLTYLHRTNGNCKMRLL